MEQLELPFPPELPPDILFRMRDGDTVRVHLTDGGRRFVVTSEKGDYINEMIVGNEFKRLLAEIGGYELPNKWRLVRDHG